MKKIILSLILALAVIFSCVAPAFAEANSDGWVLYENAESIRHHEKNYIRIYNLKYKTYGYSTQRAVTYRTKAVEKQYKGTYVNHCPDTEEYLVEVVLNGVEEVLYVAEDYMEKFEGLKHGGNVSSYKVYNKYNFNQTITYAQFNSCTASGTTNNVSDNYYEWYDLYAIESAGYYSYVIGAVVKNKQSGKLSIIKFEDYDTSYFFADGSFDRTPNKTITLYGIDDEVLANEINEMLKKVPDDGLDWLAGKDPSEIVKVVSAVFFFGLIPLAVIVFCIIALKKTKKKMYRAPLIVLLSSAIATFVAAVMLYH